MSVALLCVQFRNVLPSEELLLFARALWNDLQQRGDVPLTGDATLCITQIQRENAPFEATLTIEGSPVRTRARDDDALLAVQDVFAQLGSWRDLGPRRESMVVSKNASLHGSGSLPDTSLETG